LNRIPFSYESTVIEGTNLTPVEAVHRGERILSSAEIGKLFYGLK